MLRHGGSSATLCSRGLNVFAGAAAGLTRLSGDSRTRFLVPVFSQGCLVITASSGARWSFRESNAIKSGLDTVSAYNYSGQPLRRCASYVTLALNHTFILRIQLLFDCRFYSRSSSSTHTDAVCRLSSPLMQVLSVYDKLMFTIHPHRSLRAAFACSPACAE